MTRKAVLVGIDEYRYFENLSGCVNDVELLRPLLDFHHGDVERNFETISIAGTVGRDELLKAAELTFAGKPSVALFFFAGHGNSRGTDELKLCTSDGTKISPGVHMSEIMTIVARSDADEKIVVLDCCFSGGGGGVPQIASGGGAFLPEETTILAASGPDEVSRETRGGNGVFTAQIAEALRGGAADVRGHVTTASIYAYVDSAFGAFQQRPTLRANVRKLQLIRKAAAKVSNAELRQLQSLFRDPYIQFALDPSFEKDAAPQNEENESIFRMLQNCRDGGLLEPVEPYLDLYWAAMGRDQEGNEAPGFCRLTPLGRHYCEQVSRGLV